MAAVGRSIFSFLSLLFSVAIIEGILFFSFSLAVLAWDSRQQQLLFWLQLLPDIAQEWLRKCCCCCCFIHSLKLSFCFSSSAYLFFFLFSSSVFCRSVFFIMALAIHQSLDNQPACEFSVLWLIQIDSW